MSENDGEDENENEDGYLRTNQNSIFRYVTNQNPSLFSYVPESQSEGLRY